MGIIPTAKTGATAMLDVVLLLSFTIDATSRVLPVGVISAILPLTSS